MLPLNYGTLTVNEIKFFFVTKVMSSLRKAKLVIFAGGEFCGTEFVVVAS